MKALLLLSVVSLGGCDYSSLIDDVVESSTSPSGTMTVQLSGATVGSVAGLASSDPLVITGTEPNLVVSMTAGSDANGVEAYTTLATTSESVTINFESDSESNLEVHYGGVSCKAETGTLTLTTGATSLAIDGTFNGNGIITTTGVPCAISGTLASIPQSR